MSKDINITITNNQNNTSMINNSSDNIDNVSNVPTPPSITTPRRTVLLLASNPNLAVTSSGNGGIARLTAYEGREDQIFLTSFHLSNTSMIMPLSSVNSVLTSDKNVSPTETGLVVSLALSDLPLGRPIIWTFLPGDDPTNRSFRKLSLIPSNLQMKPLFSDDTEAPSVPTIIALDTVGVDFLVLFLD